MAGGGARDRGARHARSALPGRVRMATGAAIAGAGAIALASPGPVWAGALIALLAGLTLLSLFPPAEDEALYAGVIARLATPGQRAAARIAAVLTAPLAGAGVAAYAGAALALVLHPRAGGGRAADWTAALGTGLVGLGVVVAADAAGLTIGGAGLCWAVALVGTGLSLFWGSGSPREQVDASVKTIVGIALTIGGVGVILDRTGAFGADAATLIGAVAVLVVLAFVFVPRWLLTRRRAIAERQRRELEQQRAEVGEMPTTRCCRRSR